MFCKGAITKRMTAIEEMAGMDILCSDKTGTLTLNRLTVDKNLIEVQTTTQLQDCKRKKSQLQHCSSKMNSAKKKCVLTKLSCKDHFSPFISLFVQKGLILVYLWMHFAGL